MKTIELPGTTLAPSQLCLGTNHFGTAVDEGRAGEICDAFAAAGGNFFDTARSYGDWDPTAPRSASERTLGRWLQGQDRADFILATKGCEVDFASGNFALRVTPAELERDLLDSLDSLQVDYVDLYWLHRDDPGVPVAELLDALIAHQHAGRIRYFGCSNWSVERIEEAQRYAQAIGHTGFVACQPMWGLAEPNRQNMQKHGLSVYYEDGYRGLHEAGMTMIPYSGQSRGVFTKLAEKGPEALAEDVTEIYLNAANLRRLAAVQSVARARGVSVNEVVLAYLLCQPNLTVPIIGASSAAQLRDSVRAVELALTPQDLATLRDG